EVSEFESGGPADDRIFAYTPNPKLRGPIGTIFQASQNLAPIPFAWPEKKGERVNAPANTVIYLVDGYKEKSTSTPAAPRYYSDVYQIFMYGVMYPISVVLKQVKAKLANDASVAVTPSPAAPQPVLQAQPAVAFASAQHSPLAGILANRQYKLAFRTIDAAY